MNFLQEKILETCLKNIRCFKFKKMINDNEYKEGFNDFLDDGYGSELTIY